MNMEWLLDAWFVVETLDQRIYLIARDDLRSACKRHRMYLTGNVPIDGIAHIPVSALPMPTVDAAVMWAQLQD